MNAEECNVVFVADKDIKSTSAVTLRSCLALKTTAELSAANRPSSVLRPFATRRFCDDPTMPLYQLFCLHAQRSWIARPRPISDRVSDDLAGGVGYPRAWDPRPFIFKRLGS